MLNLRFCSLKCWHRKFAFLNYVTLQLGEVEFLTHYLFRLTHVNDDLAVLADGLL